MASRPFVSDFLDGPRPDFDVAADECSTVLLQASLLLRTDRGQYVWTAPGPATLRSSTFNLSTAWLRLFSVFLSLQRVMSLTDSK
jgi:hypothetical protein